MNKKLEIFVKFLIVSVGIFLFGIPLIMYIYAGVTGSYQEGGTIETIINFSYCTGLILGSIMIFIQFKYNVIKMNPGSVPAEEFEHTFTSFNDFLQYMETRYQELGYDLSPTKKPSKLKDIKIFLRREKTNEIYILAHCEELKDELLKEIETYKDNLLEELNDTKNNFVTFKVGPIKLKRTIIYSKVTTIVCVDGRNQALRNLVNNNIFQEIKESKLPIGLSFDNGTVYVTKQTCELGIEEYKKLRKQFLKIMGDRIIPKVSKKKNRSK